MDDKIKNAFVDTLKGKPVAKDVFGTVIGKGDFICWGAGSQKASQLNFGRVMKINYKKDYNGIERVSSVTCKVMKQHMDWDYRAKIKEGKVPAPREVKGFHISHRKQAVTSFQSSWVLDNPPEAMLELFNE